MEAGTYVDPSVNYEQTAEAWANLVNKPFHYNGRNFELDMMLLESLFNGVYPETIEFILVDPVAFADRVAEYRANIGE